MHYENQSILIQIIVYCKLSCGSLEWWLLYGSHTPVMSQCNCRLHHRGSVWWVLMSVGTKVSTPSWLKFVSKWGVVLCTSLSILMPWIPHSLLEQVGLCNLQANHGNLCLGAVRNLNNHNALTYMIFQLSSRTNIPLFGMVTVHNITVSYKGGMGGYMARSWNWSYYPFTVLLLWPILLSWFSGTPEIGGLTTIQAMEIIRGCKGMNIVGGDVVEVQNTGPKPRPIFDIIILGSGVGGGGGGGGQWLVRMDGDTLMTIIMGMDCSTIVIGVF